MKLRYLLAGLMSLAVMLMGTPAFANALPKDAASMSVVVANLQKAGYVIVKEVEFNKGTFEAKTITINGQEVKVLVDNQGNVIKPKVKLNTVSILTAIKKAEAAGYSSIYAVEAEKNAYELKALDSNRKSVKLKVDAITGEMFK